VVAIAVRDAPAGGSSGKIRTVVNMQSFDMPLDLFVDTCIDYIFINEP